MIAGLTGLSCSGKNYIASIFEKYGAVILDLDKLGHKALEVQKEKLVSLFGGAVIAEGGAVDRRAIARAVFTDAAKLKALEDVVHPLVSKWTAEWAAENSGKFCIINAALLHKSALFEKLDFIIIVRAPYPLRLWRALKRDGASALEIMRRFKSQRGFLKMYYGAGKPVHIINNGLFSRAEKSARALCRRVCGAAGGNDRL